MVLSRVRLIRVRLVLVNLNPINDTYIVKRVEESRDEGLNVTFPSPSELKISTTHCVFVKEIDSRCTGCNPRHAE